MWHEFSNSLLVLLGTITADRISDPERRALHRILDLAEAGDSMTADQSFLILLQCMGYIQLKSTSIPVAVGESDGEFPLPGVDPVPVPVQYARADVFFI